MRNNNKNSGGNTMSLKKSATRRLSLLAGSSLVAASLSAFAFTGLALTPTAALAYDECVPANPPTTLTDGTNGVSDPTLNGATADNFACAATPYATGITYSSAGDLAVSKTNTGTTTVTANGVNLSGNGADSVTWDSSIGTVTAGASTNGPLIDVTSVSGSINITTGGVTANTAGTTHAIRATSTGGGDITIGRVGTGAVNSTPVGGTAAIEAVTNGGDISITTTGSTGGRVRGILAQTSGVGGITMAIGGSVSANTTDGVAVIDATAGTGGINISITSGGPSGGTAPLIRAASASAVNVQNTGGFLIGSVDFSGVTGGGVTFNNAGSGAFAGRWTMSGASVFSAGNDTVTFAGTAPHGVNNGASMDFGLGADRLILAGDFTMGVEPTAGNPAGTSGAVIFGGGPDILDVSGRLVTTRATFDFGADADTFTMSGVWVANGESNLPGLDAFNNSGLIWLGGERTQQAVPTFNGTDDVPDDVLRMAGATFTGSGDSRVVMDVELGAVEQAGCVVLTVADCLDLRDGSSAGTTLLTINNVAAAASVGGRVGITLVDLAGEGASAAGHFVLDPNSEGYVADPLLGGVIESPGLFRYALQYDPGANRHLLVGLPKSEILEYAVLSGVAQSLWHMTTDTVTDRQSDLRAGGENTVWLRANGEYSKRDTSNSFESFGDTFTVDNSYKLYAGTIMAGRDFIVGHSGGYDYVAGAQIGYVSSSFELNASPTTGRFTGATGGIYGSVWSERLFLDATFNMNGLTLDYQAPGLGSKTTTFVNAIGARGEGGMRFGLTEHTFVEPLATLSFTRTSFEEISLFGGEVQPANANSRRAALGLRVGADYDGGPINIGYFVTGRAWNEFDGDTRGAVTNPGANLDFADEFSGGFGEAEAGVTLTNDANTLAGSLTSGVKWKDGYSAVTFGLGLRAVW